MGIAGITRVVPSHTNFLLRNHGPYLEQIKRLEPDSQILQVRSVALQSLGNIFLNSSALEGFYDREMRDSHRTVLVSCRGFFEGEKAGKHFEYTRKDTSDILAAILPKLNLTTDEITFVAHLIDHNLPKTFIGESLPYQGLYPEDLIKAIDIRRLEQVIRPAIASMEEGLAAELKKRPAKHDISFYFFDFGIFSKLEPLFGTQPACEYVTFVKKNEWTLERIKDKVVSVRDDVLSLLRNKVLFEERTPTSFIGRIYTNGRSLKVTTTEYTARGIIDREIGRKPLYERVAAGSIISLIEQELGTKMNDEEKQFIEELLTIFLPKEYSGEFYLNGEYKPLNNLLRTSQNSCPKIEIHKKISR